MTSLPLLSSSKSSSSARRRRRRPPASSASPPSSSLPITKRRMTTGRRRFMTMTMTTTTTTSRRVGTIPSSRLQLLLLLLVVGIIMMMTGNTRIHLLLPVCQAEIRSYSGDLEPEPFYIHYSSGYLVAPGSVDLSPMLFTTIEDDAFGTRGSNTYGDTKNRTKDEEDVDDGSLAREGNRTHDDEDAAADGEDQDNGGGGGDDGGGKDGNDGNDRSMRQMIDVLLSGQQRGTAAAGGGGDLEESDTIIDIVLFEEPSECAKSKEGCDWTSLGIGSKDIDNNLRWCCWDDAIDLNMCKGSHADLGRLLVNSTLFNGEHRAITIPSTGQHELRVSHPIIEIKDKNDTGMYILVMANCNGLGRTVHMEGQYTWKNAHGYLPGERFGELYFFVLMVILYLTLLLWYGISMNCHKDSTIPIQKWILVTIFLGLLECFFKGGDLWVWNIDGVRFWFAMYIGIVLGVMKRAISRALILMVSLGWGVIRDTLDDQFQKIIFLGIVYVGVALSRDILAVVAIVDVQTISTEEEIEIIDVVTILTIIVAFVDVMFYMWILDALNGTMQYLENMNQNSKLLRYLRLRLVLLLSILFAIMWAVFGLVDQNMDSSILDVSKEWSIGAAWQLNYIAVLTAVAVLWRPNDTAKEYAFVMELPSVGGDVEFSTNDGVVNYNDDDEDEDYGDGNDEYGGEHGEEGAFAGSGGGGGLSGSNGMTKKGRGDSSNNGGAVGGGYEMTTANGRNDDDNEGEAALQIDKAVHS